MALVFFTGGIRSGKSQAAQRLAEQRSLDGHSVSVAVFGRADLDMEMAERVHRHQKERPSHFTTVEVTSASTWDAASVPGDLLLVDCLGTALGLVMEEAWQSGGYGALGDADAFSVPPGLAEEVELRFSALVGSILAHSGDTIVVSNEVGDAPVAMYASARIFTDILGRANRRLVASADAAYLVVAGRLMNLSAASANAHWPVD